MSTSSFDEQLDRFIRFARAPAASRFLNGVVAGGTGTVLAVALSLQPDPSGHGTHLQLGLGTCSFLQLTGAPCPMCGATTTFTLLAHGRLLEGFVNQPFAALLFLLTVVAFAIGVAEVLQPRDRWARILELTEPYEAGMATIFLGLMGLGWAYKAWLLWPVA